MSLEPVNGYDFILSGRSKTPVFRKIDESGKPKLVKTASVPEEVKMELMRRREQQQDQERLEEARAKITAEKEVTEVESVEFDNSPVDVMEEEAEVLELRAKVAKAEKALTELLPMTVFEATLEQLASEMSTRFGVYTVFLNREPQDGDIHPITSEPMNMYERGLAYKQFVKATMTGRVTELPEPTAPPRHEVPREYTIDQDTKWRTQGMSSHTASDGNKAAQYNIDGIVGEPPLSGEGMVARTIIDPSWVNKGMPIEYLKERDGIGNR